MTSHKYDYITIRLGERVRALRTAKGFSQADLEKRSGLERTYISSMESGRRNIGIKGLAALADALNVSLAELFEGVELGE